MFTPVPKTSVIEREIESTVIGGLDDQHNDGDRRSGPRVA